ncbi:MAG: purine-nucleoside phosphorylase [Candidatus Izimaplasma sp.]|nr:purine-nucleoside phosphorylase [Candidatus Izimaplasma bacterium]
MYEKVLEATNYIKKQLDDLPKTAIVLGSGLSSLQEDLTDKLILNYADIPHFKTSTVKGHESALIYGKLNQKKVLLMTGRFHFYEGFTMKEITFPIYMFKLLGIKNLILTNSCGGINEALTPGDIMVINDFINLMPTNPLIGVNDERFGPRFPDMTEPYDLSLRKIAKSCANTLDIPYKEGIYTGFMGPYYETKAEIKMIKRMGSDTVGMSTVPETIVSHYLGIKTLAFATVTNMATGIQKKKHSHDHVVKMANKAAISLRRWIKEVLQNI